MRSHQSSSHAFFLWAFIVPCGLTFLASPSLVFAEDQTNEPGGKAQRKQQLERQLKSILDELDDLKQGDRPAPVQPLPVQPEPQAMTEPQIEQGPAPEISLEDMSIISKRLQKHPEGVTLTSTPQSEYDSQPTRNMRESLESLPGVIVRQANGPRDFSISLRGSGVKTSFAIRDLKI